jgi:hypothetical protein
MVACVSDAFDIALELDVEFRTAVSQPFTFGGYEVAGLDLNTYECSPKRGQTIVAMVHARLIGFRAISLLSRYDSGESLWNANNS